MAELFETLNSVGNDYGILTHKPLVTVAPFTIYDHFAKSGKAQRNKKISNDVVGIINVEVLLIRSMIVLDEQEVGQVTHFHRVVTLLHNGKGDKNSYYSDFIKVAPPDVVGNWEGRSEHNKYGEVQYAFVPLSEQQLPWSGYDIDLELLCEMERFEMRMLKIQRARARFLYSKKQMNREGRQENDDTNVDNSTQTQIDTEKAAAAKKYTGDHPLLMTNFACKMHKRLFEKTNNRVFFTPWENCGKGFEYLENTKLDVIVKIKDLYGIQETYEKGRKKPKLEIAKPTANYIRWDESTKQFEPCLERSALPDEYVVGFQDELPLLHPAASNCYLSAHTTNKPGTMPNESTRKGPDDPVKTYDGTFKDNKPRGYDTNGYILSLDTTWSKSETLHLTNIYQQLPAGEYSASKELFKEHVEVYFLTREMFIKGSWLPSVSVRLVQLLNAEETRIAFVTEYNRRMTWSEISPSSMNDHRVLTTTSFLYEKDNKGDIDVTEIIKPVDPPKNGIVKPIKDVYKCTLGCIKVTAREHQPKSVRCSFDDFMVSLTEVYGRLQDNLGVIHPPPIIGEMAYFLPPSTFYVSDRKTETISPPVDTQDLKKEIEIQKMKVRSCL